MECSAGVVVRNRRPGSCGSGAGNPLALSENFGSPVLEPDLQGTERSVLTISRLDSPVRGHAHLNFSKRHVTALQRNALARVSITFDE